jgi:hypothetical protein
MSRLALVAVVAMAGGSAAACGSPLSPIERVELNAAEARWAARPFQAYSIEMLSSCFFVAEFDPQLGFPTSVSFVPKEGILDAGSYREMRNAAALPSR